MLARQNQIRGTERDHGARRKKVAAKLPSTVGKENTLLSARTATKVIAAHDKLAAAGVRIGRRASSVDTDLRESPSARRSKASEGRAPDAAAKTRRKLRLG
jgi:hypothetical protein